MLSGAEENEDGEDSEIEIDEDDIIGNGLQATNEMPSSH